MRVWFAIPYLVVRILGLSLQVLVEMERTDDLGQPGSGDGPACRRSGSRSSSWARWQILRSDR